MLSDQGKHDLLVCFKGRQRCRFVFTHQPAIPGNVSTEDGGQLAFKIRCVQRITSSTEIDKKTHLNIKPYMKMHNTFKCYFQLK